MIRNVVTACGVCLVLLAVGCGKDTGIVPVTGVVTFNGQAPPSGGTVWFTAVESAPGFPLRPGLGDFGADGKFSVKSYKPGDGLMPGSYKVYLTCWKREPEMGGPPPISHLPKKYQSVTTSEMELTVEQGSDPVTYNVDIAAGK